MKISVSFSESDVSVMVQSYLSSQNICLTSEATKEVVAKLTETLKGLKLDAESLAKFTPINIPFKPYTLPYPDTTPYQHSPFWYGPTSQYLGGVAGGSTVVVGAGLTVEGNSYNKRTGSNND